MIVIITMMITEVRERQAAQKVDVERFSLKVKKEYQIEISSVFEALKNVNDSEDIKWAWENIIENIKVSAEQTLGLCGQKQHKLWVDEECSQVLVHTDTGSVWTEAA